MLISIIVPVFNMAPWLVRCVESLFYQGLPDQDYEIILVNDGSTDGSVVICQQYEQKYPCVRLVTQDNQGLSVARNTGIREARGEWLCFVDADDYLAAGGLAKVADRCDMRSDLVRYVCKLVYGKEKPAKEATDGKVLFEGRGHQYLKHYGLETFCCNWLYRRSFLMENDLWFCPGIIAEDFRFIADVLLKNPAVVSTSTIVYNYEIRKNSLSTEKTPRKKRKMAFDLLNTFQHILDNLVLFRETDQDLFHRCFSSLQGRLPLLFSTLFQSDVTPRGFEEIIGRCRENGLIPAAIDHDQHGRTRWCLRACNYLSDHYGLFSPVKVIYRGIFIPIIKPLINRNG